MGLSEARGTLQPSHASSSKEAYGLLFARLTPETFLEQTQVHGSREEEKPPIMAAQPGAPGAGYSGAVRKETKSVPCLREIERHDKTGERLRVGRRLDPPWN